LVVSVLQVDAQTTEMDDTQSSTPVWNSRPLSHESEPPIRRVTAKICARSKRSDTSGGAKDRSAGASASRPPMPQPGLIVAF